jgi:hypothetical protein
MASNINNGSSDTSTPLVEMGSVIKNRSKAIDKALGKCSRHRYDLNDGTSIFLERKQDGSRHIVQYGPFGAENHVEVKPAPPTVHGTLHGHNNAPDVVLLKAQDLLDQIDGITPTFSL